MIPELWLKRILQWIAIGTLFAFAAAVMPEKWIVEIAEYLGFEPFPAAPITFYLARNLSLLYGFIGVLLLIVAYDLRRYRPLVNKLGWGAIAFGVLQGLADWQSQMPLAWTLYEVTTTIAGGILLLLLDRYTEPTHITTTTAEPQSLS